MNTTENCCEQARADKVNILLNRVVMGMTGVSRSGAAKGLPAEPSEAGLTGQRTSGGMEELSEVTREAMEMEPARTKRRRACAPRGNGTLERPGAGRRSGMQSSAGKERSGGRGYN